MEGKAQAKEVMEASTGKNTGPAVDCLGLNPS